MITIIEQAVQARLVAAAPKVRTVTTTLRYDRTDPYAVEMVFPAPATLEGIELTWTFSRELLLEGLTRPTGMGDVRVRPYSRTRTVVEFHAPEGVAVVLITSAQLRLFLDRISHLVPRGREQLHLDLDLGLAQLLDEAG
ncbi:SsgA family sporulation/cell division regulator [Streptomyces sp. NPDC006879]|uniref:SsgA family sporulation/cell division regulator n=1 Tax=Streptomyces sp. NPDC006879 TaxID=3364767 RepID=UPI0036B32DC8